MGAPASSVAEQPFRTDRTDAVRWIVCFAVVVAAHGVAALSLLPSPEVSGGALRGRPAQGPQPLHRRWPASPQLPLPARRPRHRDPQCHGHQRRPRRRASSSIRSALICAGHHLETFPADAPIKKQSDIRFAASPWQPGRAPGARPFRIPPRSVTERKVRHDDRRKPLDSSTRRPCSWMAWRPERA